MKKIINAVAGDGKLTPAKKYTAYAAMITAALFALVLVILIVSSVVFAVTDGGTNDTPLVTPSGDNASDDNVGVSSNAVQYETVSSDGIKKLIDSEDVEIQKKRSENTSSTAKYYYAMSGDTLKSDVQKAMDSMLVAYYNEKSVTVFVGGAKQIEDSNKKTGFIVELRQDANSFSEAKAITYDKTDKNGKYNYIYENAYKYGFVYENNFFTYVGTVVSTYMKNKNITDTDKLITSLTGKAVSVSITAAGATKATTYQIYYLSAGGELKVPTNYGFDVVPNGSDGYFVIINTADKKSS